MHSNIFTRNGAALTSTLWWIKRKLEDNETSNPLGPSPHLPPLLPTRWTLLNCNVWGFSTTAKEFQPISKSWKRLSRVWTSLTMRPSIRQRFHPSIRTTGVKKRNKKEESSRQELMALPTNPSRHLKECQKIPQKILKDPSADVGTRRNVAKESAPLIQLLLSSSWANKSMKSQSIINQHDKLEPFHLSLAGATSLTAS